MSATPKQYVDLNGLSVYHEEMTKYVGEAIATVDEISEMTDTSISTPTDKQALLYNGQTSKWENKPVITSATVSNDTLVLA